MDDVNRPLRARLWRLTVALTALLVSTLPAGAQVEPVDAHRLEPCVGRLGMTAPPDLDGDGRLPPSRPAPDGATDCEFHLDVLGVDASAEAEAPVVRGVTQFADNVVAMSVSGSLKTAEFDFRALARKFHEHYPDEFDYLVFVSNLPTVEDNEHYRYYGVHMQVQNAVGGIGLPVFGSGRTLKSLVHLPARRFILFGPMLHELLHAWANFVIPTAVGAHWGFSSANGQLGGFDIRNLVSLGNGRYSAGRFGTVANGGNSVPYSPIELYLAGLIPPEEVPDLWVAKDGRWLNEEDASGNRVFLAPDVETWSARRIVDEYDVREPDWTRSQKSFRAATVLLTDDEFPATPTILRDLADAVRTFSHPGPDRSRLFNFWEATGGRATLKMDDLQRLTGPVPNRAPVPVGTLRPQTLSVRGATKVVDVAAAFWDPDGDALTYGARSSAPGVASVSVFGSRVTVTPTAEGAATVTVTATDTGGSNTTVSQTFAVTVAGGGGGCTVENLGAVSGTVNRNGTLGHDCVSPNWTGELARYYSFTLAGTTDVRIDMTSSAVDAWLGLREGAGISGSLVLADDDSGSGTNARIEDSLPAGTYTIEASTAAVGVAATGAFSLTIVTVPAPANRPPEAVGVLPPVTLGVDDSAVTVDVASAFRDPDGDALTYRASSSAPHVVTARAADARVSSVATVVVFGTAVRVTPVAAGTATVTVTATDAGGLSATQAFTVTVTSSSNRPPERVGTLAPLTIGVENGAVTVEVSRAFRDPDGDPLSYGARSSAPGVASVSVFGSRVTVTPTAEGAATVTVTATDTGGSNTTVSQTFAVTVAGGGGGCTVENLGAVSGTVNRNGTLGHDCVSPNWTGKLARYYSFTLAGTTDVRIDMTSSAVDAWLGLREGAGISGSLVLADDDSGSGTNARIEDSLPAGTYTIEASTAAVGVAATGAFSLTIVTVPAPANRPPEAVGVLPPVTLGVDDSAVTVDVASAFRDPDGDALTYRASSSAPHVVTARAADARVTLAAVDAGTAMVEVTATDPDGLSAVQSFRVRVTAPFTDDPIVPGVTPIGAVHFTELRARIDVLRQEAGLAPFGWTDRVLRAGMTRVRLTHLLELRSALAEAYAAAGRPAPRWTDASPAAESTPIRAAHVAELRAAVRALE